MCGECNMQYLNKGICFPLPTVKQLPLKMSERHHLGERWFGSEELQLWFSQKRSAPRSHDPLVMLSDLRSKKWNDRRQGVVRPLSPITAAAAANHMLRFQILEGLSKGVVRFQFLTCRALGLWSRNWRLELYWRDGFAAVGWWALDAAVKDRNSSRGIRASRGGFRTCRRAPSKRQSVRRWRVRRLFAVQILSAEPSRLRSRNSYYLRFSVDAIVCCWIPLFVFLHGMGFQRSAGDGGERTPWFCTPDFSLLEASLFFIFWFCSVCLATQLWALKFSRLMQSPNFSPCIDGWSF